MRIENVRTFQEDGTFSFMDIAIRNGRFAELEAVEKDEERIDGGGCYAIPGLIDLHFHGCMGADFSDADPDGIACIAAYEAAVGVTSICPATMTLPEEALCRTMRAANFYVTAFPDETMFRSEMPLSARSSGRKRARLVGIHMEGPFLSTARKGAQAAAHIRKCDVALFRRLQKESGGRIRFVDIAPEEPGALSFIDALKDEVVISLAHTMADYDTAMEAFARGATHVTHLYNAMPPLHHRNPGVVGAARDTVDCRVELICDGIHLHPSIVRATFAMFGAERIILVSDSMRATGLSDGQYTLGGQDVAVCGSRAALADGTIAGSVTDLMSCLQKAVREMGISLADAVTCATANPAKELGIYDFCGSITPGKAADLVLLDQELKVRAVYLGGVRI
jgi:N-acetylglucosamine-6-phosphate deacetylase